MNLVVCFTPLQILIAKKVIQKEGLDYNSIHFVYFSNIVDAKHNQYYQLLAKETKKSDFIKGKYSFNLLLLMRGKFFGSYFDKVLLASIDDSIAHYLLSFIKFNELITFDDGLGNILKTGSYFVEHERKSFRKRFFSIVHSLFGRKYYLNTIKERSERHYTIYKNFVNCIANPIFVSLFEFPETQDVAAEKINLFLGTIYDEIATSTNGNKLKLDVLSFMGGFAIKPKYLPHPRALDDEFENFVVISNNIAEDVVFELVQAGFEVNLYGFASSCQFNLSAVKNVNICVLDSKWLTPVMKDGVRLLADALPEKKYIHL